MSKSPKSTSQIWRLALLILLPVTIGATWFGRGTYDRLFMMEGRILVVNSTDTPHKIQVSFPSGKNLNFDLAGGAASEAHVEATGEGSVRVVVDGTRSEDIGYVTSRNSMVVLTVSDSKIVFSQLNP
jgi:hypothetical protein